MVIYRGLNDENSIGFGSIFDYIFKKEPPKPYSNY